MLVTIGPLKLSIHVVKTAMLGRKSRTGARPTKGIHNFKTKSIRKLSNFNFQWTKILYQNNFNNIAFFTTFSKGSRRNQLSVITPKKIS